jgi:SAM-dependent methyltransferase
VKTLSACYIRDKEGMSSSVAGAALADKASQIAAALGLDPSLPLIELLEAASRRTGRAVGSTLTDKQMKEAEMLLSGVQQQQSQPPPPKAHKNAPTFSAEVASRLKLPMPPQHQYSSSSSSSSMSTICRSCMKRAPRLCSANGCCQRCLDEIHQADRQGHDALHALEEAALQQVGGDGAHHYGDMTRLGFRTLGARIELCADDVFVDCGSGTGRAVLQAAREYDVQRAFGVELSKSRHRLAQAALAAARKEVSSRSVFLCGDCADPKLWQHGEPLAGATVVFTCSVMFSEELMARLARCIEACPSVRLVATLKRFPPTAPSGSEGECPSGLRGFREAPPPETCETSWMAPRSIDSPPGLQNPGSSVYIYVRERRKGARRGMSSHRRDSAGSDEHEGENLDVGLARLAVSPSGSSEWVFTCD